MPKQRGNNPLKFLYLLYARLATPLPCEIEPDYGLEESLKR